jgi:hypothetical protein
MSTINKVLTLALHPATPKPEVITAFLKARQLKATPESIYFIHRFLLLLHLDKQIEHTGYMVR